MPKELMPDEIWVFASESTGRMYAHLNERAHLTKYTRANPAPREVTVEGLYSDLMEHTPTAFHQQAIILYQIIAEKYPHGLIIKRTE